MMTLKDFLKLEELEKEFFGYVFDNPDFIIESIDIDCCAPIYDNYKDIIYQDIIQETLNKTYDFSKFKSYLSKEFGEHVQLNADYKDFKPVKHNNNRLVFQTDKTIKHKNIEQVCDLFGYKIASFRENEKSKLWVIEPIYLSDKSDEVNKMKYIYHVVPLDDKYKTFDNIKESFKKKYGLKPSKREKKSKHFRRTYCFTENCKKEDIFSFTNQNNSLNDFILIRIKLEDYLKEFPNRKIEWFEDPNMINGIWTREIIPYKFLEFFEIINKEFLKDIEIK